MECGVEYGARLERGVIVAVTAQGYVLRSEDRPGLVTPPLRDAGGITREAGGRVVFFMFDDGTGRIVCACD